MKQSTLTQKLIRKILLAFAAILVCVGVCYVLLTFYFTEKYFDEVTQKLNGQVAYHLIEEKFGSEAPFLEDGSVNKPLFGDLMHDMMAVNRGIEVYLLDENGDVDYSVVLDHSDDEKPATRVDVEPIRTFIASKGEKHMLGDDPRNPGVQKIFSAAPFDINGNRGYIYIILASKEYEEVTAGLASSYYLRLGLGASIATIIFALLIGALAIYYLTRNLRDIIQVVRRFKEGDLTSRVAEPDQADLSVLATTFNDMADTIVTNIDELKSVESLRRELVANVSHDLRTPLAIMQGYVETLRIKKDTLTDNERDKYLGIVENSIENLSRLINQLFEYSKLEARQIEPQKEPFSISDLAHDVYEKYQSLAAKKNIKINLDVEEQLPLVFADISLVERVIQNLMDNALKYTPDGGTVTIALQSDHKDVFVAIKDTGPGISDEEQSYIFERFKRASKTQDSKMGAGLGLAIAKKIMDIHESSIGVISAPNQGTTFRFNLPMHIT